MSRSRRNIIINSNKTESLDLGVNVDINSVKKNEIIEHDIKQVDVPPKSLYDNSIKLKSFHKLRRGYKLQNQKAIFINDIKQLLLQFPAENPQYDDELLIEILNIAESFFIYGTSEKRENIKNECISDLMKKP